jgi:hypothetical protein
MLIQKTARINSMHRETISGYFISQKQEHIVIIPFLCYALHKCVTSSIGMPAIILLCRGLFGKNVWTLNFRYNPISNPTIQRTKVTILLY